ncbi:MAG: hypothetical protein V2I45_09585, partial [Halieaceae bacterium]|nr:hypothetical protein [Halieaceae bacterium]
MFKKLFGAALVAFMFSGIAAQAATVTVTDPDTLARGSLDVTGYETIDLLAFDNGDGTFSVDITSNEETPLLFELVGLPFSSNISLTIMSGGSLVAGLLNGEATIVSALAGQVFNIMGVYGTTGLNVADLGVQAVP